MEFFTYQIAPILDAVQKLPIFYPKVWQNQSIAIDYAMDMYQLQKNPGRALAFKCSIVPLFHEMMIIMYLHIYGMVVL